MKKNYHPAIAWVTLIVTGIIIWGLVVKGAMCMFNH
jgi:hypothetical protein